MMPPDYQADDAPAVIKRMREIACSEGRHEYKDGSDYCRWCSAKRKEPVSDPAIA